MAYISAIYVTGIPLVFLYCRKITSGFSVIKTALSSSYALNCTVIMTEPLRLPTELLERVINELSGIPDNLKIDDIRAL